MKIRNKTTDLDPSVNLFSIENIEADDLSYLREKHSIDFDLYLRSLR